MDWQPGPRLFVHGELDFLSRGSDSGSDVFNSYIQRAESDEEDQDFLSGDVVKSNQARLALNYYLTSTAAINFGWETGNYLELGLKLNW